MISGIFKRGIEGEVETFREEEKEVKVIGDKINFVLNVREAINYIIININALQKR